MVVNFCGNQIFMDFVKFLTYGMIIYEILYAWCIRYCVEGNFGSGKLWRIYSINTLAKENLVDLCNFLSENISENVFCKTFTLSIEFVKTTKVMMLMYMFR